MQSLLAKHQVTKVTQPSYSPDLAPYILWLFPKLKSPLKGKSFQTIDEIQENMTGQLTVTGRTVWGPKVPLMSLSYVQCFLFLVSSSIHVSIFHITWLGAFWTDLICFLRNYCTKQFSRVPLAVYISISDVWEIQVFGIANRTWYYYFVFFKAILVCI